MSEVGGTSGDGAGGTLRWAALVGLVGAGVLVIVYFSAWAVFGTPLAFMRPADDAFYYFDVACHVVHHGSFSTDGIHATNGFHPLWMLVLLPFAAVFEAPSQGLVVSAQLLSCVGFGLAVAGIAATARRGGVVAFAAALGALTLLFPKWRGIVDAVVEGGLAVALLAWMAYAAQRLRDLVEQGKARPRDAGWFGLLAGLSLLARLDTIWVVGLVCLVVAWWIMQSDRTTDTNPRALVLVAMGIPVALLGGYVVVNLVTTGHLVPVSGQLKSTFPSPHLSSSYLNQYRFEYGLLLCAALGLVVAARRRHRLLGLLLALTVGAAIQGAYVMLFMPVAVFWWYFVSLLPAGLLGVTLVVDEVMRLPAVRARRRSVEIALGVLATLVLVTPIVLSLRETSSDGKHLADSGWRIEAQKAGHWAGDNLPANARLSMIDSGAFGYYTPQEVMNLDGVISSYDFHDAVCKGHLVDELRRAGVRYFASHTVPPSYTTYTRSVPCWPTGKSTPLTVDHSTELYRSQPYIRDGRLVVFVIWALPATITGA